MKLLALLTLLALVPAAGGQSTPPATVFTEVGIDQNLGAQIPLELTFRDEQGREVTLGEYFHDKPVILSLVYYRCPMLCTQVLNGMVESFRIIKFSAGKEFTVVTVSIDPAETSELARAKKAEYVSDYGRAGVDQGWHFLTGDQVSISRLAKTVGFKYVYDEQTNQFAHASGIMIATPEGKLSRYLYGVEYAANDLTFSLMESAREKIGSPAQKLQLLCYAYDPSSGKYSLVVTNLLRFAGVAMLLALGGYIVLNIRREKRKALRASGA